MEQQIPMKLIQVKTPLMENWTSSPSLDKKRFIGKYPYLNLDHDINLTDQDMDLVNLIKDYETQMEECRWSLIQSGSGANFLTYKSNPARVDDIFIFDKIPQYLFVVRWIKKKRGRSKFMEIGTTAYLQQDYDLRVEQHLEQKQHATYKILWEKDN